MTPFPLRLTALGFCLSVSALRAQTTAPTQPASQPVAQTQAASRPTAKTKVAQKMQAKVAQHHAFVACVASQPAGTKALIKQFNDLFRAGKFDEADALAAKAPHGPTSGAVLAQLEYRVADLYSPDIADGDYSLSEAQKSYAILKKFLKGGQYGWDSRFTKQARVQYGAVCAALGKNDEAKTVLGSLQGETDLPVVFGAFRRLDEAGLVQTPQDVDQWVQCLGRALSQTSAGKPQFQKELDLLKTRETGELPFYKNYREAQVLEYQRGTLRMQQQFAQSADADTKVLNAWKQCMASFPPASEHPKYNQVQSLFHIRDKAMMKLGQAYYAVKDYANGAKTFNALIKFLTPAKGAQTDWQKLEQEKCRMWLIGIERAQGAKPEVVEPEILAMLRRGNLDYGTTSWAFTTLAKIRAQKGDAAAQYAYLSDLVECVPGQRYTRDALSALQSLAGGQAQSQPASRSAVSHSPGYQALADAGRLKAGAHGQMVLKTMMMPDGD